MSTRHHESEVPQIPVAQPEQMKRIVDFIDRFTAMVVAKLQVLEKSHGIAAPKPASR